MSRKVSFRWDGKDVEATIARDGKRVRLTRDGRTLDASVTRDGAWVDVVGAEEAARCAVTAGSKEIWVSLRGRTYVLEPAQRMASGPAAAASVDEIRAPMTGRVVRVTTSPGSAVAEGDLLLTIEAMKMEFKLTAPEEGRVDEILCTDGDRVELGQLLVRLTPAARTEEAS